MLKRFFVIALGSCGGLTSAFVVSVFLWIMCWIFCKFLAVNAMCVGHSSLFIMRMDYFFCCIFLNF